MSDYRLSNFKLSDYMIESQLLENTRSFKPITQEELVTFTIRPKRSPALSAWINFEVDKAFSVTIATLIKTPLNCMHLHRTQSELVTHSDSDRYARRNDTFFNLGRRRKQGQQLSVKHLWMKLKCVFFFVIKWRSSRITCQISIGNSMICSR